jgi:hybrid cluster-associated redox disulfide protein
MHCVGCAIAPFETIAEACAIYGLSVEALFAALDRSAAAEAMAQP